ncbi:uncharacterized protein LOC122063040 [Macadamia integrifolia]|uniref:uncharacterized protein LOC122063040 n=1 Tax=Macadamia integrifolia TaxID=60698 RepID=UPI001C4FDF0D|nr:uncharacterized protein LOC122063040 [Macadamia integrifolia]
MEDKGGQEGDKRSPSRLQKKAPKTALQLDHNMNYNAAAADNPSCSSSSSSSTSSASRLPIPLLSPLIVAPPPLPQSEGNKGVAAGGMSQPVNHNRKKGEAAVSAPPRDGCRHPATNTAPFTKTSSLFSFFHSQCCIVHHHI